MLKITLFIWIRWEKIKSKLEHEQGWKREPGRAIFLLLLLMNIFFCTVINSFLILVEHDKNIYNEENSVVKKTLFSFLCINSQNTQN